MDPPSEDYVAKVRLRIEYERYEIQIGPNKSSVVCCKGVADNVQHEPLT